MQNYLRLACIWNYQIWVLFSFIIVTEKSTMKGMLMISISVYKFISMRCLFGIDLYVLKFVFSWLCAEQGKDLDEFFCSTAGMIFRTIFIPAITYTCLMIWILQKIKCRINNHWSENQWLRFQQLFSLSYTCSCILAYQLLFFNQWLLLHFIL